MKLPVDQKELAERIRLNFRRLCDGAYYQINDIYAPKDYDWPGDKEGRALLAFVSHYKISGEKIPCMEQMMVILPEKLNDGMYLGETSGAYIREQQLSGHSWMLRGLCEYHEQFHDARSLEIVKGIVENLYLPTMGKYASYPVDRDGGAQGGVGGNETGVSGIWQLSSDIGCAFMSIDGLSHAYALLRDERVKALVDEMTEVYLAIDKRKLRAQTHCTLSAARGMMRMYGVTGEKGYLDGAKRIYDLYVHGGGMTLTDQNLNWWNRPDTWTEPCAIVDSLMLALELYKATGEAAYRTVAARVYHNGFATAQRDNGGAGTDTLVCAGSPWKYLAAQMYEAYFCCTMRLAEGLWYVHANREQLYAELDGDVTRKESGVYSDGDLLYAQVEGGAEAYAERFVEVDGHRLSPLMKYYRVPKKVMEESRQVILFE